MYTAFLGILTANFDSDLAQALVKSNQLMQRKLWGAAPRKNTLKRFGNLIRTLRLRLLLLKTAWHRELT